MDVCLHFPVVFIALCLMKQKNNTLRFRISNYWHVTPCRLAQTLQQSRRKRFHHANLHGFMFQKSTIPKGLLIVFPRFVSLNFASQTGTTELHWKHSRRVENCRSAGRLVQMTGSEGRLWCWSWRGAGDIQDQRRKSHSDEVQMYFDILKTVHRDIFL